MSEEKMEFQAEVGKVLDIVVNALYSNTDVFLRELISNASDACDKLRYAAIVKPDIAKGDGEFKINIIPDKEAKTLTISDNGIGMNREDLIKDLGSIGKSGSAEFLNNLTGDKQKDATIIGQFGVGFYSAFMVAEKVEVRSRKAGEDQGWLWSSTGRGIFTISEEENVSRGTQVKLFLKKDFEKFAEAGDVRTIVRQFSDHISFPVVMNYLGETETINQATALWTRNKAEITEKEYSDFYRHISNAFDEPWDTLHYKAEGTIEYTALMFIPSKTPFDIFQPDRNAKIQLYVNRVFITDQTPDMMPNYLRFVQGIIDTKELPLNVSREMLQKTPVLTKIKSGVVRRILGELKKKTENTEDYLKFWNAFGTVLKEGLFEDSVNRDEIADLCRFNSTESEGVISLSEYISRMKPDQKSIYYITGDNLSVLRNNPQLEGFAARGIEVLLLTDPIDEFWPQSLTQYKEKTIKSIQMGALDLKDFSLLNETKEEKCLEDDLTLLKELAKEVIGDEIKEVRTTERLTKSPVALSSGDGECSIHLERMMRQHNQPILYSSTHYFDINPYHPLIKLLAKKIKLGEKGDDIKSMIQILYDQAKIIEGEAVSNPAGFSNKVTDLMLKVLNL
ncbi:MAG: molecular chaperone HtpG [Alphaproteobacteria bacterium]|nr:molecular chaperone HtpG [Alphaproteobacteria bacterium]